MAGVAHYDDHEIRQLATEALGNLNDTRGTRPSSGHRLF